MGGDADKPIPEAASSDLLVIGSGAAGLTAALAAAVAGLEVTIIEKTDKLGGTSAMSGAGTWVPANHHARAAGIADSPEEALEYLRATAPEGWRATEDRLWQSFVAHAPDMLEFVERHTPLRYALTTEADPYSGHPGAKPRGRMLSPRPLSRRVAGPYASRLRHSTLPHIFTYHEGVETDLYHHPVRVALRLAPALLWRLATNSAGKGTALIAGLLRGCLDQGCRIELEARALALSTNAQGEVVGAVVEQHGERRRFHARRAVLLATGGFEWNAEMVGRHFPGPLDYIGSPRSNEGDGHRMAAEVGAQLDHMDQANVYPAVPTLYEGRLQGMPVRFQAEPNAILVDRTGRRFADEHQFNLGEVLDRRDPVSGQPIHLPAWLVTDARFLRRAPVVRWHARYDKSWLVRAGSIEELAERIGLPRETLRQTVNRFNELCAKGQDDDFGRGRSKPASGKSEPALQAIEAPPFLAMRFSRTILSTKGGARTNEHGQVLRKDGSVIAGLYCAGVAMANPIGTRAVSAGTTIGPNMTWGYICALSVLRANQAARS